MHVKRGVGMCACLTCDCVHGTTYKCTFQVTVWCRAEKTRDPSRGKIQEKNKNHGGGTWLPRSGKGMARWSWVKGDGGMCEVSGEVWRPVLVPPPLTLLLLVLPSRLSARFWLITLSSSRLFPERQWKEVSSLSLFPTAAAWALPCPPGINQHTHAHPFKLRHTLSPASLCDGQAAGQPSLLQILTCKWDIQPLGAAAEQDIRKVL